MMWAEEQGQIKAGVGPFLVKQQRERQAYVVRQPFPTRGDKAVRAQSIRGRMALEGLYLPTNKPWAERLRSELLSFPAGKYDDQVDALGLIGQLLDIIIPGEKPRASVPVQRDAYNRRYRDEEEAPGKLSKAVELPHLLPIMALLGICQVRDKPTPGPLDLTQPRYCQRRRRSWKERPQG